jgi:Tol biopolymer transport system component
MTRKRWIILAAVLVVVLILAAGSIWLVRNIPAAARLVYGDPAQATQPPAPAGSFAPEIAISTLTPTAAPSQPPPTATATSSPSPTPSATPTDGAPTDAASAPSPAATSTASHTPTLEPPTATSTPAPPTATPTPRPQWIAFETKRGSTGDYEIFAMAPDGSRLTNVSSSWADDVAPVWSPDGRRIAFVSFRHTLTGKWGVGKGAIYVMDFDPATGQRLGEARRVTDDGGSEGWPTWSPDGKRLAFHSDRSDNWDIWIINVDGSGLTRLTTNPTADRYPAWSPDGKRIAFTSKRSGNEDVWVIDVEKALSGSGEQAATRLTDAPDRDRYPMWSSDGKQMTFNSQRDGNYEVYVMNANGSNPRNISQSPKSTEGLADWSPDDRRLVMYSDRSGNKEVYIIDLASGQWTNITNNPASDEFCTWSP